VATGVFGGIGSGFLGLQNAPPWAFLGGALGTTFVLGSIIAIPQAGAVVVICSGIVGQMIGSYLIDTFGCLGVDKVPFSWVRLERHWIFAARRFSGAAQMTVRWTNFPIPCSALLTLASDAFVYLS